MAKLHFYCFSDYEEGKMAHTETTGDYEIPMNVFIDNADEYPELMECICEIDLKGVSGDTQVFATEDAYRAADTSFDTIAMIPMGTFSPRPNDTDFKPSPHIIFSGIVREVAMNSDAPENEPNYKLLIETLDFSFHLFLRHEGKIETGYIAHGVAWLFGDILATE